MLAVCRTGAGKSKGLSFNPFPVCFVYFNSGSSLQKGLNR